MFGFSIQTKSRNEQGRKGKNSLETKLYTFMREEKDNLLFFCVCSKIKIKKKHHTHAQ
jgi:hypothetical protein